jgi:hypothetical protein
VAAGAAESLDVDELRATTTSARTTIATITAATMRLEDPDFAVVLFGATGAEPFAGADEITVVDLRAEVGTGGTTKLDEARLATFFVTPFLTADFFATFLAGAFLATFFATFLAAVFLAGDFLAAFFAVAFLAVFLAAVFFTATYLLLG